MHSQNIIWMLNILRNSCKIFNNQSTMIQLILSNFQAVFYKRTATPIVQYSTKTNRNKNKLIIHSGEIVQCTIVLFTKRPKKKPTNLEYTNYISISSRSAQTIMVWTHCGVLQHTLRICACVLVVFVPSRYVYVCIVGV